jgi:tRNA threonylcarbamoyladenosine biosynthesis protein TsaE
VLATTEDRMLKIGENIAALAAPGIVVAISGPLGVGKTTLVRGILRGLGWKEEVRSPTFNLIHEYSTIPPVCHADLHRLRKVEELRDLGLTDYFETHFCLIEWPEIAEPFLPGDAARIQIEFANGARELRIEGIDI